MATILALVAVLVFRSSPSPAIFYGLDVPSLDRARLASAIREVGVVPAVENVFIKLDSASFTLATLQGLDRASLVPMISLEPWGVASSWTGSPQPQYRLSMLSSGRYDREFQHVAALIAQFGKPVYLRFAHEMNGRWYPWAEAVNGNHPGDYVRAWRHVAAIFHQRSPNATLIWSPNAVNTGASSGGNSVTPSLTELFPGDRYVDAVGMTAYGHGGSASATLAATYSQLLHLSSRPVILSEVGADGPTRPEWIADFGRFITAHHRIVGFVWFNTAPRSTGASGDYRFDATPASTSAFAAMLRAVKLTRTPLKQRSHRR